MAYGRDGPTYVVAASFALPRGETLEWTVRFRLPPARRGLWLEPAARVPPLQWRIDRSAFPAESRRYYSW